MFTQSYVDLLKLTYTQLPNTTFNIPNSSSSTNHEIVCDLTLPLLLKNNNALLTGFVYENYLINLYNINNNYNKFETALIKLGYNHNHSSKLNGTYLLLPKIAATPKTKSSNKYQIGGTILYKYKKNEQLKYNFGMYYNSDLFGPFFVPLFGAYYKSSNEKLEINTTLPVWADINYQIYSAVKLGINFSASAKSFFIDKNDAVLNDTYIEKTSNDLYTYIQIEPFKRYIIQSKIGYTVGRGYDSFLINDKTSTALSAFRFNDNRTQINPEYNNGLLIQFRLIYRFYTNK